MGGLSYMTNHLTIEVLSSAKVLGFESPICFDNELEIEKAASKCEAQITEGNRCF